MNSLIKIIALIFFCQFSFSKDAYATSVDTIYHKEELIEINGTKIFIKVMGKGEPLLLIHGGPGLSHDYFLPHVLPLAENHQLIFYDQRGTGRSSVDLDSAGMALNNFVEDIEAIRKHFGIDKLNIVGHSWGGFLAGLYAIKYKNHVKSIVFWDASPMNSHLRDVMLNKQKDMLTNEDHKSVRTVSKSKEFINGEPKAIKRLFWAIFKPSFFAQKLVYKLDFYFNENYAKSQILLLYMYADLVKYDYYNQLQKLKAPALIFQGENDPMPIESAQELHRQIRNSEMVIIKECGHFPFVEKPKELFSKMESFYLSINSKN